MQKKITPQKIDEFVKELKKVRKENAEFFKYFRDTFKKDEKDEKILAVTQRFYFELGLMEKLEEVLELYSIKTQVEPSSELDDKILIIIKFILDQKKDINKVLKKYKNLKENK